MALSTGLLARYKLYTDSVDSVAAANGVDTSITYADQIGQIGGAAILNGTSSLINLNALVATLATLTTGSLSFWFKLTDTNSDRTMFCLSAPSGNTTDFLINFNTSTDVVYIGGLKDNVVYYVLQSANNISRYMINSWNHLCITHDGVAPILYINGQIITLSLLSGSNANKPYWWKTWFTDSVNDATTITVGALKRGGTVSLYSPMKVKELCFWDRALTRDEVAQLSTGYVDIDYAFGNGKFNSMAL